MFDKDMTGFIGVGQLRYSKQLFPLPTLLTFYKSNVLFNIYLDDILWVFILMGFSLFAVLTNLGEKMSDDEVDELLKAVDTSSGEINYTGMYDFVSLSLSFILFFYFTLIFPPQKSPNQDLQSIYEKDSSLT